MNPTPNSQPTTQKRKSGSMVWLKNTQRSIYLFGADSDILQQARYWSLNFILKMISSWTLNKYIEHLLYIQQVYVMYTTLSNFVPDGQTINWQFVREEWKEGCSIFLWNIIHGTPKSGARLEWEEKDLGSKLEMGRSWNKNNNMMVP